MKTVKAFRSKKHLYAKAADSLANSNGIKIEPELCYEMSYRYPEGSYPLYIEVYKTQAQDLLPARMPLLSPIKPV